MRKLKLKLLKLRARLQNCLGVKKTFLATILISYIGTIIIGVIGAVMSPNCDFKEGIYRFGACNNDISLSVYLLFNVSEVLAPTTITFSGTILVLQSDKTSVVRSTILWLIMLALVGLSGCLQWCDSRIILMVWASLIVALSIASIVLSWSISDISQIKSTHKNEISDGKLIS